MIKTIGWTLISIAVLGLTLSICTLLPTITLGSPDQMSVASNNAIPGYHYPTLQMEEARDKINRILVKNDTLNLENTQRIVDFIFLSFYHGKTFAQRSFLDNWVLRLLELSASTLSRKQSFFPISNDLVLWAKKGGWCHQASRIFIQQIEDTGLQTRILRSDDHVIAEVLLPDQGWTVVDTDYGIVWPMPFSELQNTQEIGSLHQRIVDRGYSKETAEALLSVYQDKTLQWSINPYDYQDANELEELCLILCWAISLLFLVSGTIVLRRT